MIGKKKKIKGVIFISDVTKAMEHEWFVEYINRSLFDIEFVLFNSENSELYNFLVAKGVPCQNHTLKSKLMIPLYVQYFWFVLALKGPDFVHCHLFQASIIGIIAAKLALVKKRIYTRHHADIHHVFHPNAVKYDLLVNNMSTHIIAVSKNIEKLLVEKENVPASKITVITHGIPVRLLEKQISDKDISLIKKKYRLENHSPIVGVIARLVEWKGVQHIIPAFKMLLNDFSGAKLVIANATGNYETQIHHLLKQLPANSYHLIVFENEINPLFKSFDLFVHAPTDGVCEAFGQVYIEALSLDVPMVCTLSGIAFDLISDGRNALVARYQDPHSIYQHMKELLSNAGLRDTLIKNGREDVKEYTFEKKYAKLEALYLS